MAAADYAGVVQQLYVSYFGRPADYYGLASFEAQLATLNAPTTFSALNAAAQSGANPGLTALVNSFSNSAESTSLYGTGTDTISLSKFVNAIYNNVLNRDADVPGLTFWVNAIKDGILTRANAAAAITDAATSNTTTQGLVDAKTVAEKTAVATDFTASLTTTAQINGYSGDAAAAAARALLKSVTSATDPVAFHSTVVSTITNIVTGSQPSTTTALTLNQDSLTGGSGNDTFTAGAAIDAQGNLRDSLQGVDIIDGGAGNDTLNVTEAEGIAVTATIKNVENINASFASAGGSLSLASATGVSVATIANSTAAGSVTGVGSIATLGVSHQTVAATFVGNTAKTLGLNLDTVGKSSAQTTVTVDTGATTLNVTANAAFVKVAGLASATTVSIAATGSNKLDLSADVAALKTVTVTGSGSVDLTSSTTLTAVTKFDASGNGGGVTALLSGAATTINGGAGDDSISVSTALAATAKVNLGAGDDVLTIGAVSASGAAVAGGDGTDTLVVTDSAFLDANSKATYTGFEVLDVSNNTGGALVFDPTLVSGITSYVVDASADSVELKNLAAGAGVTVDGDLATALVLTLKDATGATDAVSVTLDNGATATTVATGTVGVTIASLEAAGVETITLHSNGTIGATAANANVVTNDNANNTSLTKVIIDGSADISFTTGAITHNLTVDASTATGSVAVDASAATAAVLVNINGGAGADSFKGGIGGGAIYGGAAGDTIDLTAGVGHVDTLVYKAAGDSTFSIKASGALDATLIDSVTAFTTAEDKLDLTSLGFTANTDKVVVQKAAVADLAHLATLAATADFYNDASSIARGVVVVGDGTDTFVFVDANHDHKFDASTDLVIKLAGTQALVTSDVIFG